MSKLDDIFKHLHEQYEMEFGMHKKQFNNSKVKQAVKDLMLELIGKELHDCPPDCTPAQHNQNDARNELISELRQKVEEL